MAKRPRRDDFTLFGNTSGDVCIKCDWCRWRRVLGQAVFVRTAGNAIKEHQREGCVR